jgi:hypothetical protein
MWFQVGSDDAIGAGPLGLKIRPFVEADEDSVVGLWDRCGLLRPWNDPRKDIARKLTVQRELFLVGEVEGRLWPWSWPDTKGTGAG